MIRTNSAQPKKNLRPVRQSTRHKAQGVISRDDAISILKDCMHVFGVECLRGGVFPVYMHIIPTAMDQEDQRVALSIYVDLINKADEMNFQVGRLREKIESYVGPINRPFKVVLRGYQYEIIPKVCLN